MKKWELAVILAHLQVILAYLAETYEWVHQILATIFIILAIIAMRIDQ